MPGFIPPGPVSDARCGAFTAAQSTEAYSAGLRARRAAKAKKTAGTICLHGGSPAASYPDRFKVAPQAKKWRSNDYKRILAEATKSRDASPFENVTGEDVARYARPVRCGEFSAEAGIASYRSGMLARSKNGGGGGGVGRCLAMSANLAAVAAAADTTDSKQQKGATTTVGKSPKPKRQEMLSAKPTQQGDRWNARDYRIRLASRAQHDNPLRSGTEVATFDRNVKCGEFSLADMQASYRCGLLARAKNNKITSGSAVAAVLSPRD